MDIKTAIKKFVKENSGICQGDKVAIIYNQSKPALSNELFDFLSLNNFNPILISENKIDRKDINKIVKDFKNFDAILSNTEVTLFHNKGFNQLANDGIKFVSLTGADISTFTGKAAEANFIKISESVLYLTKQITRGYRLLIETENGTRLEGNISGRIANAEAGINRIKNPSVFPDIEVNTSVIEKECNGTLCIDLSMTKFGKLVSPLYLAIKKGKILKIEGYRAKEIKIWMGSFNDPNILQVAEFGFGLNPNAEITGNIIEDESKLGTAHIGFGNNIFMGGKNEAVTHFDMVFDNPKVFLDGKLIINGKDILI